MDTTTKETGLKIFNACQAPMTTLYGRWQDEKEYEDFASYKAHIKAWLVQYFPEIEFVGLTKVPFAFKYKVGNIIFEAKITKTKMSLTAQEA